MKCFFLYDGAGLPAVKRQVIVPCCLRCGNMTWLRNEDAGWYCSKCYKSYEQEHDDTPYLVRVGVEQVQIHVSPDRVKVSFEKVEGQVELLYVKDTGTEGK